MAEISDTVRRSVRRFLAVVGRERRVVAAYVYGSEVRQQATEWSDIDVAVISPDFADDLFLAQLTLMKLAARIDDRIEPRAFTPESFNINDPLASIIQETGVRVV
jgi:uncharacterized protein